MRRGSRGSARSGPGLLRTMGRTAVVAGTATVVARGVSGAMDSAVQQRAAEEQQEFEPAVHQTTMQQASELASAPAMGSADRIAMLQQLAELKAQGILTDAEFEAEKARILGS